MSTAEQKVFGFEDVELTFTEEGLDAIANQAIGRGTGARGLRAILEDLLLDTMFELPGRDDVAEIVIDADTVVDRVPPTVVARKANRTRRAAS